MLARALLRARLLLGLLGACRNTTMFFPLVVGPGNNAGLSPKAHSSIDRCHTIT